MKYFLLLFFSCLMLTGQNNDISTISDNPFFNAFNEPIDFAAVDGNHVNEAASLIQKRVDTLLLNILAVNDCE